MSAKHTTQQVQPEMYQTIPYPGLRPFTCQEAALFFGREQQIEAILRKLSHDRFLALIAPSGGGKTSLVQAGLIASLKKGEYISSDEKWRVSIMRPGEHPIPNLAEALKRESLLDEQQEKTAEGHVMLNQLVLSHLRRSPSGLVKVLQESPLPENTRLLLIIDQFEDIFRFYNHRSRDEMRAFVAVLIESVRQTELPIHLILTIRSEYLGKCVLFQDLPGTMNSNQILLPLLLPDQLRPAILEPARQFEGSIDTEVVNALLHEMEDNPDQLPLLQHCLMRIWLRAQSREQDGKTQSLFITPPVQRSYVRVTLDDYMAVGGLKHALSNHADETFRLLDAQQQQIAKRVFCRFADRRADKRSVNTLVRISDIASIAQVSSSDVIEVVEVFRHPEHCFLMPGQDVRLTADSILSISHESLLQHWNRLSEWIEEEARSASFYRHLEHTASLWQQRKASLWRSPELDHALEWKTQEQPTAGWALRYGNAFELAMTFLDASERKSKRKRHLLITFLLMGLLIIPGLTAWGIWERSQRVQTARLITSLPTAVPSPIPTPLPIASPTPAPQQVSPPTLTPQPVTIRRTYLRQTHFYVKPGETAVLGIELQEPPQRHLLVHCQAIKGTVECAEVEEKMVEIHYTAPDTSGKDMVEIQLEDQETGETKHTLIKVELLDM